jgi:hypothetical protein
MIANQSSMLKLQWKLQKAKCVLHMEEASHPFIETHIMYRGNQPFWFPTPILQVRIMQLHQSEVAPDCYEMLATSIRAQLPSLTSGRVFGHSYRHGAIGIRHYHTYTTNSDRTSTLTSRVIDTSLVTWHGHKPHIVTELLGDISGLKFVCEGAYKIGIEGCVQCTIYYGSGR